MEPPKKKRKVEDEVIKTKNDEKQGDYFWNRHLHEEFMKHFSVWGKTWKVVSQKMIENGIVGKDQLQCRTHGQKYLLSLQEIQRCLHKEKSSNLDKKIYQKICRYEEDKRYLLGLYGEDFDRIEEEKTLQFQDDWSKQKFENSIPDYIRNPTDENKNMNFDDKVKQIRYSVDEELILYDYLKDLKKDLNKKKRMSMKTKTAGI